MKLMVGFLRNNALIYMRKDRAASKRLELDSLGGGEL